MNDTEALHVVRARLATVEAAIEAYLEVAEQTGTERQAAYKEVGAVLNRPGWQVDTAFAALRDFYYAYERTLPRRKAAIEALQAALTTDFQTAVVCSADMTHEQRAEWLRKCEPPETTP